jgi:hypothetical protein
MTVSVRLAGTESGRIRAVAMLRSNALIVASATLLRIALSSPAPMPPNGGR